MKTDVVVVGAGIIGLAIAESLSTEGYSVTLVERKEIAGEASAQNAGALAFTDILPLASPQTLRSAPGWLFDPLGPLAVRPAYAIRLLPWLGKFVLASRPAQMRASIESQAALMALARTTFHEMASRSGAAQMIRRDGCLQLYEGQRQFDNSLSGWNVKAEHGIAFEHVHGDRLIELQPGLSKKITSGTFVPGWETVSDPRQVALAVHRHITSRGVVSVYQNVRNISPRSTGVEVQLDDGVSISAGHAVIAAGAWSAKLTRQLGDNIPLETERGYNTTLPPGAFDLKRQLSFAGHGFVVTPLESGIRVGGAVEFGGLELPPDFRRSEAMLNTAARLLSGLRTEDGKQWMGFRPSLPDTLPIIGRSLRSRSVIYAFGHGHLGLTQSAATGLLVRDLISDRNPTIQLEAFRPNRF